MQPWRLARQHYYYWRSARLWPRGHYAYPAWPDTLNLAWLIIWLGSLSGLAHYLAWLIIWLGYLSGLALSRTQLLSSITLKPALLPQQEAAALQQHSQACQP